MPDLDHLHPEFRRRVIATGHPVNSAARSHAHQRLLYEAYLRGQNPPANPPGTSNHEYDETAPFPHIGVAEEEASDLPGGCWAYAVDFHGPPYPHGAPGLHFPIRGEPWHAQPVEIGGAQRQTGQWRRLPIVGSAPPPGPPPPPPDPLKRQGRIMLQVRL